MKPIKPVQICTKCRNSLPYTEEYFYRNSRPRGDGTYLLMTQCKTCLKGLKGSKQQVERSDMSHAKSRQALIQKKQKKGRPHYTPMVVRDVIQAIQENTAHHLRLEVEQEDVTLNTKLDSSNVGRLIEFCSRRGIREILAKNARLSISTIDGYLCGELILKKPM